MNRERSVCGWAGVATGLLALGLALLPDWIAATQVPPSKSLPESAADWIGDLKDRVAGAARRENDPPLTAPHLWRQRASRAALLLAFGALALGVLAFVRHEEARLMACSIALAAGAIAVEHPLTALLIIVFAVTGTALARRG